MTNTVSAQVVASTPRGIAVAHDGRVELFDSEARRSVWSVPGVESAAAMAVGRERIAVIDSFANAVTIVNFDSGHAESLRTGETPLAAVFMGNDLYVLDRDAQQLESIGADGTRSSLPLDPDPAFLREANGLLYVYSRLAGSVQEISPATMKVMRTLQIAPFACDFEADGRTGYLVFPREAKIRTFSLQTMRATGELSSGVVPVDLAVTRKANAISAATLSVADPSARRVWIAEGTQSMSAAVARGFVRGLLGLGLFRPRSSDFPSGVDRIVAQGKVAAAYDSATRTLYRLSGSKGKAVAGEVGPSAFAVTSDGIAVWENGRLRLIR